MTRSTKAAGLGRLLAWAAITILPLAGCANTSMTATAPAGSPNASGIRFAVIAVQGPAPETAQRFGALLDEAAKKRGLEVIPPSQPGDALRVRAYLDAHAGADGKAGFAWVLDASGDGVTRAARVNGAAASSAPAAAAWTALDDAALRQIAEASVDDLLRKLAGVPDAAPDAEAQ